MPTTGGTVTQLSPDVVTSGDVADFEISPSGDQVVYLGDQEVGGRNELDVVATTGGPQRKISGPIAAGGGVVEFAISPDGVRVAFTLRQSGGTADALYSVPLAGGDRLELAPAPMTDLRFVEGLGFTPDSSRVAFLADPTIAGSLMVFSVRAGYECAGRAATIVGTSGPDVLTGTPGPDVIVGLGGADTIRGRGGNDIICAGGGADTVNGGGGNDRILGQGGRDTLTGRAGNDIVVGDAGRDTLRGNRGNDILRGGGQRDELRGGAGNDRLNGGAGSGSLLRRPRHRPGPTLRDPSQHPLIGCGRVWAGRASRQRALRRTFSDRGQAMSDDVGEIKRMWVHARWRGLGIGRRLLAELENHHRHLGHHTVRLDTNSALAEAIAMYESSGYRAIGRYNDNPFARHSFEKSLAGG